MIEILYEDDALVVCEKPVGVLSQPDVGGTGEDILSLLGEQLRRPSDKKVPYVGLVHRLDRGVGGVMVFAKRPEMASRLSVAVAERSMTKQYLAVVHGCPDEPCGILRDLLYKDSAKGKSFVVDRERRGVKKASLAYRVLSTVQHEKHGVLSLVHVRLHTGRTHQIRVQFSSRGMPLVGDGKYGARDHGCPIGLWSYRLTFAHPSKRATTVDVCRLPTASPFDLFQITVPADELPDG